MQVLTSLLLASTLIPTLRPTGDRLAWEPSEGIQLQRTIHTSVESVTDHALLVMDGDEQDVGSGMERSTQRTIEITDTFGPPSATSGPSSLQRTFDTVTQELDSTGAPEGVQVRGGQGGSGLLEGLTVGFTLDEETGDYEAAWADDSEGKGEWLEGLHADMDGAAFLPGDAVSAGDSWEIDLAAAGELLWPGGELFVDDGPGADNPDVPEGGIVILVPSARDVRRLDELEGSLIAKYAGQREVDGRSVGVIELELELEGELDIADHLQEDSPIDQVFDSAVLGLTYEGSGELHWDLEGHHMASLAFEARTESETEIEWAVGNDDFSLDVTFEDVEARTHVVDIRVERVDPE